MARRHKNLPSERGESEVGSRHHLCDVFTFHANVRNRDSLSKTFTERRQHFHGESRGRESCVYAVFFVLFSVCFLRPCCVDVGSSKIHDRAAKVRIDSAKQ